MKNKFKTIKNIFGGLIVVLTFLLLPAVTLADNKIDVEYPVGSNLNGDDIFDERNIYPGWEKSKTIRIKNKSNTDGTNLFFTFDIKGDKRLADELRLYVIRQSDNSYRIGGAGDRYTLKEADERRFYVDNLAIGESEKYKIKIRFNREAGNEFQRLETKFDIDFKIESEEAGWTEAEILASEGRTVSGNPPEEEVAGVESSDNETDEELVAGEEKQCQNWPKWGWVLALIVFAVIFLKDAGNNYKDSKYGWKFALIWTIFTIIFWYLFDTCHEFKWFLYGLIIIAIVGHTIFVIALKKKIEKLKLD